MLTHDADGRSKIGKVHLIHLISSSKKLQCLFHDGYRPGPVLDWFTGSLQLILGHTRKLDIYLFDTEVAIIQIYKGPYTFHSPPHTQTGNTPRPASMFATQVAWSIPHDLATL